MSLKSRIFTKDARRSSLDVTANLMHLLKKLCKDKPIRLTQLKVEYDRYFKDRISSKPTELVTAALKSLEGDVIAVKVFIHVDNRELTDLLLGLRSSRYATDMVHEDSPHLSKERIINIIRDADSLGIHVRELEERYVEFYGTRPSYLPYKSMKELLHRTPDVELASSGKTLRVRIRPILMRRTQSSKIPSLNRSSLTSSLRVRKTTDLMSMSVCKMTDSRLRRDVLEPSDIESPSSSGSGSPTGSVDMSVSMILPKKFHNQFLTDRMPRKKMHGKGQAKEVMATILNDLPPEGMTLKALTEEFLSIIGNDYPLGMTTAEFLNKEFNRVIKLEEDECGLRVFKLNSPLVPRRTIAEVYTKLALQSNRKPSDRVLKVLKDIYQKRDLETRPDAGILRPPPSTPELRPSVGPAIETEQQKAMMNELQQKLTITGSSKLPVPKTPPRTRQNVFDEFKLRLQSGPVTYPSEFQEITKDLKDDSQTLLVDLMSTLNLCLKPLNGAMVLQAQ